MFKLTGRILDWTDEESGLQKTSDFPLSFSNYALVLEDYEGVIGKRYPIATMDEVGASMDSFEKYASRLMPLHRRTAATFMSKACSKYDMPMTEKVAMYTDDSIKERTVTYKKALADYEPTKLSKEASSIISGVANIGTTKTLDFGVDTHFIKQASFELASILKENEVCEYNDPLVGSLKKLAQDEVPLPAIELYKLAKEVCKMAELDINRTIFRDPYGWPKEVIEKEASEDSLDEFILENIKKLEGHFNSELIEKIAESPTRVMALLPSEISKIAANLLTSNE
jgi:hypothetical protein